MSSLDSRQNLNEQENHDRNKGKGKGMRAKGQKPQTVIFPKCVRKSFFKMGGLMSNLWKCTNQLFGAAQPIVMYKPDLNTPLPFVRGWMHMFWGVRSQQVPVYVHTLSAQLWFYFLFAIIAEKVD